jgi:hypothetical protein
LQCVQNTLWLEVVNSQYSWFFLKMTINILVSLIWNYFYFFLTWSTKWPNLYCCMSSMSLTGKDWYFSGWPTPFLPPPHRTGGRWMNETVGPWENSMILHGLCVSCSIWYRPSAFELERKRKWKLEWEQQRDCPKRPIFPVCLSG